MIVLGSVKALRPARPSSLPMPLCFEPPNGTTIEKRLIQLTPTVPASNAADTLNALLMSCVNTPAIRPNSESLDSSMISSSVLKLLITATGPKTSSLCTSASWSTSVKTVGWRKYPCGSISDSHAPITGRVQFTIPCYQFSRHRSVYSLFHP
jgi:hypothetical protein